MSDFYKARGVIDKFDPVLKSYKFVRRHVECTPINQYDQFFSGAPNESIVQNHINIALLNVL